MDTKSQPDDPGKGSSAAGGAALLAAGIASLLASACCLGPLALALAGVSGAWIGLLPGLEPYQPLFLAAAAVAMVVAARRIWHAPACEDGRACATPSGKRAQKTLFVAVACLLAVVVAFPLIAPRFY